MNLGLKHLLVLCLAQGLAVGSVAGLGDYRNGTINDSDYNNSGPTDHPNYDVNSPGGVGTGPGGGFTGNPNTDDGPEIGGGSSSTTRGSTVSHDQGAVFRGFQNAEAGYSPQKEKTKFYSGDGYQSEYHRSFYEGVSSYYEGQNMDPFEQEIPSGPMQELIQSKAATIPNDYEDELAANIDREYREGNLIVSVPGREMDGQYTKGLTKVQTYGLENSVTIVGDKNTLKEHFNTTALGVTRDHTFHKHVDSLVIVRDVDEKNYDDAPIDLNTKTILGHEFHHAAVIAAKKKSKTYKSKRGLSNSEKSILNETEAITNLADNYRFGTRKVIVDGEDPTHYELYGVSPEFAKKERYITRVLEAAAFASQPGNSLEYVTNQIASKYQNVTRADARQLAEILRDSPTIQRLEDTLSSFIQLENKKGWE